MKPSSFVFGRKWVPNEGHNTHKLSPEKSPNFTPRQRYYQWSTSQIGERIAEEGQTLQATFIGPVVHGGSN